MFTVLSGFARLVGESLGATPQRLRVVTIRAGHCGGREQIAQAFWLRGGDIMSPCHNLVKQEYVFSFEGFGRPASECSERHQAAVFPWFWGCGSGFVSAASLPGSGKKRRPWPAGRTAPLNYRLRDLPKGAFDLD